MLNLRSDNRFFDVQTRPFFTTLSISLFTRESNRNSVLVKRGNTNLSTISVYRLIKAYNGAFVSSSFSSSSSSSRFRFVVVFESIEMKCRSRKKRGYPCVDMSLLLRVFLMKIFSFFFAFSSQNFDKEDKKTRTQEKEEKEDFCLTDDDDDDD